MSKIKVLLFEGIDGSGKTSNIRDLTYVLSNRKRSYTVIDSKKESDKIGDAINELLRTAKTSVDHLRLVHLFISEQYRVLDDIKQAVKKKKEFIIIDRSPFSTLVYALANTKLNTDMLFTNVSMTIATLITSFLEMIHDMSKDITTHVIYIDVPSDVGIERVKKRNAIREDLDVFENKAFLTRVRKWYKKELALIDPNLKNSSYREMTSRWKFLFKFELDGLQHQEDVNKTLRDYVVNL